MGIHDEHRKRLRENYLEVGIKGKSEHQILELLLTYAIPRIDVNPAAHELINKFGSLSAIFDADINELTTVKGLSTYGAVLLKLIPDLFPIYFEDKFKSKIQLKYASQVKEYIIPKFANETNEVFYILCLDNHMNLIRPLRLSEGSPSKATLNLNSMVSNVLNTGATQLILVHNHLSGCVDFSIEDIKATNYIADTFDRLEIKVLEHFIVSGNKVSKISDLSALIEPNEQ